MTNDPLKNNGLICLGQRQFQLIAIMLTMTCVVWMFLNLDELYCLAVREYVAPQVEKRYGFEGGVVRVGTWPNDMTYFAVKDLKPDSPLRKIGLRPGDIPLFMIGCRFGMIGSTDEAIFYRVLNSGRFERPVHLYVINASDYDRALSSGRGYDPSIREIRFKLDEISKN